MTPSLHHASFRQRRPARSAQVFALIILVGIAVYLWTAPMRAERWLAQAPLTELQVEEKRRPDDPRVLHHLALRLQEAGRVEDALTVAVHAAEVAPFDEDAYLLAAALAGRVRGDQSAFDILNEFTRRQPGASRTHHALALLYQRNGAHERALAEARQATQANPKDTDAFRIVATEAIVMHQTDIAEAAIRHALALAPNDARIHLTQVDLFRKLGRNADALKAAETAVQSDGHNADAHLVLGDLLLGEKRYADALTELNQARELQPGNGIPLRELGRLAMAQNDYATARPLLQEAQSLLPEDRTVAFALVQTLKRLGDPTAATEEARFAELSRYQREVADLKLQISKGLDADGQRRHQLARVLAAHGDLSGARQQYRLLLLKHPDAVGIRHEWNAFEALVAGKTEIARRETTIVRLLDTVDVAIAANQAEKTVVPLERAIQTYPDCADLHNRLGRALGQAGGVEQEAEVTFLKATTLEPQRVDFALDAAEMLASNRKLDAAETEYRRAMRLAPNNMATVGGLGRFLANERTEPEKNTEGRHLLETLLKTEPNNADALYGLGSQELNKNDYRTAITYFEGFLAKTGQKQWPDVWFSLARAYQLSGDRQRAEKARAEYTRLTPKSSGGGT